MERSAALTLDPARWAERALAAAQVTAQALLVRRGAAAAGTAEAGPLTELQYSMADLLRGRVAFPRRR